MERSPSPQLRKRRELVEKVTKHMTRDLRLPLAFMAKAGDSDTWRPDGHKDIWEPILLHLDYRPNAVPNVIGNLKIECHRKKHEGVQYTTWFYIIYAILYKVDCLDQYDLFNLAITLDSTKRVLGGSFRRGLNKKIGRIEFEACDVEHSSHQFYRIKEEANLYTKNEFDDISNLFHVPSPRSLQYASTDNNSPDVAITNNSNGSGSQVDPGSVFSNNPNDAFAYHYNAPTPQAVLQSSFIGDPPVANMDNFNSLEPQADPGSVFSNNPNDAFAYHYNTPTSEAVLQRSFIGDLPVVNMDNFNSLEPQADPGLVFNNNQHSANAFRYNGSASQDVPQCSFTDDPPAANMDNLNDLGPQADPALVFNNNQHNANAFRYNAPTPQAVRPASFNGDTRVPIEIYPNVRLSYLDIHYQNNNPPQRTWGSIYNLHYDNRRPFEEGPQNHYARNPSPQMRPSLMMHGARFEDPDIDYRTYPPQMQYNLFEGRPPM